MKSIWKGSIGFGLVNIPIKLYSAVEEKTFKTRMLHKEKLSPIRYKKWCDGCDEEVSKEDIVKGVEVGKDEYIVLSEEEIASLKPEKSTRIEIVEFVDLHQIDPIYFNAHYYLGPQVEKDKTYHLFREVLHQMAKAAVGSFVMRDKEYACAIEPYREGLLLTTLNYGTEIRDIKEVVGPAPKLAKEEISLAKQLIERAEVEEFDISKFKDTFQNDLKALVAKKKRGEKIVIQHVEVERTKEKNLIEALKASLQ